MNKQRRRRIEAAMAELARARDIFDSVREEIDSIREEEQEAFDNLPQSLQDGERGQNMQAAIYALDNLVSELDGVDFDGFNGQAEEAMGQ